LSSQKELDIPQNLEVNGYMQNEFEQLRNAQFNEIFL